MKVHETNSGSKRKHDEMEEDDETLTKYLIEKTNEQAGAELCQAQVRLS